jgi:hypothetical protein
MFRNPLAALIALGLCVSLAGCGTGKLRTTGQVRKGGQPFVPKEDESVRVVFVPILPDGKPPRDHYHTLFDDTDATFVSAGKDLEGMPPGKYRVAIIHQKNKRDLFNGRFDENKSPYVFEIDAQTPPIVIDLDSPPKG